MSSSGKRRKTDNNKKKKEAEKRTDEKEATKLDQRNFNNEYVEEIYSWKDQQGRNATARTEWESGELSGEFMEWNTVERATKTEKDTRTEYQGVGKLGWFMSKTETATSPPREGDSAGTRQSDQR